MIIQKGTCNRKYALGELECSVLSRLPVIYCSDQHERPIGPLSCEGVYERYQLCFVTVHENPAVYVVPEIDGLQFALAGGDSLFDFSGRGTQRDLDHFGVIVQPVQLIVDDFPVLFLLGKVTDVQPDFIAGIVAIKPVQFRICWHSQQFLVG